MSDIEQFADGLNDELLSDMADSYFGVRKDLEEMISTFPLLVEQFRPVEHRVGQLVARMEFLLLGQENLRGLWLLLGVDADVMPAGVALDEEPFMEKVPWALTSRGRYLRCVRTVYALLRDMVDEYIHGRHYSDPEQPARKRLTIHYLRLRDMARYINETVDKVNSRMSPSATLRYVKQLDPGRMKKERIGECSEEEACSLDRDLAFAYMDFSRFGLRELPELPGLAKVGSRLDGYARDLYAAHGPEILERLRSLKKKGAAK